MRIASYNVQNLFARARALSMGTWAAGRPVLEAHAQINELFQRATYTEATKRRIIAQLEELGLLHSDTSRVRPLARRSVDGCCVARATETSRSLRPAGRTGSAGSS